MKITLSKQQWELIGRKTGWAKTAGAADIEGKLLKRISPRLFRFLKSLPNYGSALDIVDSVANKGVSAEQAGINESAINQARQIMDKIKAQTASSDNIVKESFSIDVRVIATIILLILGIFAGNALQNAAKGFGDTQNARINEALVGK